MSFRLKNSVSVQNEKCCWCQAGEEELINGLVQGFSNSSLYPLGALHPYRGSDSAGLEQAGDFVPILRCGYMKGSSDD